MNPKLETILEALMINAEVLNGELFRLSRTDQFKPTPRGFQMVEQLRERYLCGLQNLQTVERRLQQRAAEKNPF